MTDGGSMLRMVGNARSTVPFCAANRLGLGVGDGVGVGAADGPGEPAAVPVSLAPGLGDSAGAAVTAALAAADGDGSGVAVVVCAFWRLHAASAITNKTMGASARCEANTLDLPREEGPVARGSRASGGSPCAAKRRVAVQPPCTTTRFCAAPHTIQDKTAKPMHQPTCAAIATRYPDGGIFPR